MKELVVELPATIDVNRVEAIVDRLCASEGLRTTMKSTLKQYPGCVHWHLKRGKAAGILEVTWWPQQPKSNAPKLWLSVHGNRMADWIEPLMPRLKSLLESALQRAA